MVRAPERKAEDPGSNPSPAENFLLLIAQGLPDAYCENRFALYKHVLYFKHSFTMILKVVKIPLISKIFLKNILKVLVVFSGHAVVLF